MGIPQSTRYHPLLAETRSQRAGLAARTRLIWHGSPALTPTTQLPNTRKPTTKISQRTHVEQVVTSRMGGHVRLVG